jgi:hypothetical protein
MVASLFTGEHDMKKSIAMVAGAVAVGLCGIVMAADPETRVPWDDTNGDQVVRLTVTNGSVVGLIAPKMILTPTGQAANGTNTITLATPFPFKSETVIMVADSSTNRIKIAAGTTFLRSADLIMIDATATEAVVIKPVATNVCAALN